MEETLDLIIHKLKEIQTNSKGDMSLSEVMSWADVINWISKETEKKRDLNNNLGNIIRELEEHRKTHSIEGLIKEEQKNRQIALELECKAEHYRGKADNYLKILKELDNCEKED